MQLVLNTFGAGISRSGQMFEIFSDGKKHKISAAKVTSILISPGINISSDAVQLALQNNIDIYFLDKYGNPVGRFWHARMGSTTRIRRAQLLLSMSEAGIEFGLRWVKAKFENQIELLKEIRSRRTRLSSQITNAVESIQSSFGKINDLKGNMDEIRQKVMGIEGSTGKVYWELFSKLVPDHFKFSGRSSRPAKDEFNAMLNYGYGVLYGIIEKSVVVAGLDPYIGFVHTDNYNKVSLVFDVIEKYRIWIEQTILGLFSKKSIKKDMFDKLANGYNIGDEGKKVLIPAINEFLDQQIRYKNRNIRRRDVIQLDLHAFAQELLQVDEG
jgi:CRISPR-associated protein Cas1